MVTVILVSKRVEFSFASSNLCEKFVGDGRLPKRPRKSQNLGFLLSSQGISSSLILLQMILEALQSEIFGFKFDSLSSKILKFPGMNLDICL